MNERMEILKALEMNVETYGHKSYFQGTLRLSRVTMLDKEFLCRYDSVKVASYRKETKAT
jgi:hypothetical protein